MSEHEGEFSPREDAPPPPGPDDGSAMPPLAPGEMLFGAECACRLDRVRRDITRAIGVLSETEERLYLDDQFAAARLTSTEAERLDRFCLNLKVAIDELQRWARSLASTVESLAGRGSRLDS